MHTFDFYASGLALIGLGVLLYLIVDLSSLIPQSVWSMFRSLHFWLLWMILYILTLLSYGVLKTTAGTKISSAVGPDFTMLATVVLAILSSLTVVQSFSLKIGDTKLVDVQKMLETFRVRVLANISEGNAKRESLKRMRIADVLHQEFKDDVQGLREHYAQVMGDANMDQAKIAGNLAACEHEARAANLSHSKLLAQKITQMNADRARDLIHARKPAILSFFWRGPNHQH
jgi:hypothetical protein